MPNRCLMTQTIPNTSRIRPTAHKAPFSIRWLPLFNRCSPLAIILPNPTIGCGSHEGSPNKRSSNQPINRGNMAKKQSGIYLFIVDAKILISFEITSFLNRNVKYQSLCPVVIVSDKHCYAEKCQQEFQGDDKDIAHNW